MSTSDFANMDPRTRDQAVRSRHLGIIRNCEEMISAQLKTALITPRNVEGNVLPPLKHEDLVVVIIHRDDPILADIGDMRDNWEQQNIEIGMFVTSRTEFAAGISAWAPKDQSPDNKSRPYKKVGRTLMQPPPPSCVYITVFDMGMCTMLFVGFDPNNPDADYVNADPNVAPPAAVEPLERVEQKPVLEQGQTG